MFNTILRVRPKPHLRRIVSSASEHRRSEGDEGVDWAFLIVANVRFLADKKYEIIISKLQINPKTAPKNDQNRPQIA